MKLRAVDLYCCAGGATKGLQRAGFHVTGVDIKPRKNYCGDAFIQADALEVSLDGYDFIWASPPCQTHSITRHIPQKSKRQHVDLIDPTRKRLVSSGADWVMENVFGAPMQFPILLCGTMFGLRVYRHRLFECSRFIFSPHHPKHTKSCGCNSHKLGDAYYGGPTGFITVAGHNFHKATAERAMDIDWMNREELAQAIPPAYSEFIARQFLAQKAAT